MQAAEEGGAGFGGSGLAVDGSGAGYRVQGAGSGLAVDGWWCGVGGWRWRREMQMLLPMLLPMLVPMLDVRMLVRMLLLDGAPYVSLDQSADPIVGEAVLLAEANCGGVKGVGEGERMWVKGEGER